MTENIRATGGIVTDVRINGILYTVHVFIENGIFEVLDSSVEVEYLVIGGGGAGSRGSTSTIDAGGGGGAGGYRSSVEGETTGQNLPAESKLVLTNNQYPITVGSGGIRDPNGVNHTSGSPSSIANLVEALGGGRGGSLNTVAETGSSGGGGASRSNTSGANGTFGQGFAGGDGISLSTSDRQSGGGGGAGQPGTNAESDSPGNGGDGISSSITGTAIFRAGGGGGARRGSLIVGTGGLGGGGDGNATTSTAVDIAPGEDGDPNTGGGGGGGPRASGGGNGGSGIVIIRYANPLENGLFISFNQLDIDRAFITADLVSVDSPDNTEISYLITGIDSNGIDGFPLSGNFNIVNEIGTISFIATYKSKTSITIAANGFSDTIELTFAIEDVEIQRDYENLETRIFAISPLSGIPISNYFDSEKIELGLFSVKPNNSAVINLLTETTKNGNIDTFIIQPNNPAVINLLTETTKNGNIDTFIIQPLGQPIIKEFWI